VTLERVAAAGGARRSRFLTLVVAALAALAILAGCSGSADGSPAAAITISDAWVRIVGPGLPAAGYLTIDNRGSLADALVAASSPDAASVEVHQTAADSSGMVGMAPVARLSCPVGATVALAPGGYHLMIMGLASTLRAGDRLELDLVFEHAGRVIVQAEVRQG
jgi:periplasmic copper chaperone A